MKKLEEIIDKVAAESGVSKKELLSGSGRTGSQHRLIAFLVARREGITTLAISERFGCSTANVLMRTNQAYREFDKHKYAFFIADKITI